MRLTEMKRYKPIFEDKQKLIEMALVGKTKGLEIQSLFQSRVHAFSLNKERQV
jgi:hypothetical protein